MTVSINPGDVFECIADSQEQIYIIEPAWCNDSWSVVNPQTDWMYLLTDSEIRQKFQFVYSKSLDESIRLQKFYNPNFHDLQERAKEGTAWVR